MALMMEVKAGQEELQIDMKTWSTKQYERCKERIKAGQEQFVNERDGYITEEANQEQIKIELTTKLQKIEAKHEQLRTDMKTAGGGENKKTKRNKTEN